MSAHFGRLCWFCLLWQSCSALYAWPQTPAARELWEQGQAAMRQGQPDRAIRFYEQSLAADPSFGRLNLSLATAYLEKDEPARARPYLEAYLRANPDCVVIRVHYAELLLRLERLPEARR